MVVSLAYNKVDAALNLFHIFVGEAIVTLFDRSLFTAKTLMCRTHDRRDGGQSRHPVRYRPSNHHECDECLGSRHIMPQKPQ